MQKVETNNQQVQKQEGNIEQLSCPTTAISYMYGTTAECSCTINGTKLYNSSGNGEYPNGYCTNGTAPNENNLCTYNTALIGGGNINRYWCQ
jgi:hypothetical protein